MKYLTDNYEINRDILKSDFKDCSDFMLREVFVGSKKAFFCAFDGLVDSLMLSAMITNPILSSDFGDLSPFELFDEIKNRVIGSVEMKEVSDFEEISFYLMSGFVFFILKKQEAHLLWARRAGTKEERMSLQMKRWLRARRNALLKRSTTTKRF